MYKEFPRKMYAVCFRSTVADIRHMRTTSSFFLLPYDRNSISDLVAIVVRLGDVIIIIVIAVIAAITVTVIIALTAVIAVVAIIVIIVGIMIRALIPPAHRVRWFRVFCRVFN